MMNRTSFTYYATVGLIGAMVLCCLSGCGDDDRDMAVLRRHPRLASLTKAEIVAFGAESWLACEIADHPTTGPDTVAALGRVNPPLGIDVARERRVVPSRRVDETVLIVGVLMESPVDPQFIPGAARELAEFIEGRFYHRALYVAALGKLWDDASDPASRKAVLLAWASAAEYEPALANGFLATADDAVVIQAYETFQAWRLSSLGEGGGVFGDSKPCPTWRRPEKEPWLIAGEPPIAEEPRTIAEWFRMLPPMAIASVEARGRRADDIAAICQEIIASPIDSGWVPDVAQALGDYSLSAGNRAVCSAALAKMWEDASDLRSRKAILQAWASAAGYEPAAADVHVAGADDVEVMQVYEAFQNWRKGRAAEVDGVPGHTAAPQ